MGMAWDQMLKLGWKARFGSYLDLHDVLMYNYFACAPSLAGTHDALSGLTLMSGSRVLSLQDSDARLPVSISGG